MTASGQTKYLCKYCPCLVIRGELALQTKSPLAALKKCDQYLVVEKVFDFDNIGQSKPLEDQVYISCADCDNLLGFLEDGKYYLAKDLVRTA